LYLVVGLLHTLVVVSHVWVFWLQYAPLHVQSGDASQSLSVVHGFLQRFTVSIAPQGIDTISSIVLYPLGQALQLSTRYKFA